MRTPRTPQHLPRRKTHSQSAAGADASRAGFGVSPKRSFHAPCSTFRLRVWARARAGVDRNSRVATGL